MNKLRWPHFALLFVAIFAVGLGGFYWKAKRNMGATEDFEVFYERFMTDSTFQLSRIEFPLEGLPTGADSATLHNGYYWTEDNWTIHQKVDYAAMGYDRIVDETPMLIKETFVDGRGVGGQRRFALKGGKWYLIYFASLNIVQHQITG